MTFNQSTMNLAKTSDLQKGESECVVTESECVEEKKEPCYLFT